MQWFSLLGVRALAGVLVFGALVGGAVPAASQQLPVPSPSVSAGLPVILGRMEGILRDYAETQGLEESSQQLLRDLQLLADDLSRIPDGFPGVEEVRSITQPHVDRFVQGILSRRQSDIPGLSPYFRLEPPPAEMARVVRREVSGLSVVNGIRTRTIVFREVRKFINDRLVFHQVIRNGRLVLEWSTPRDISILHSLPGQMRRDGVNEGFVRIVEEYINLVNYHLLRCHNEKGLILPEGDRRQLAVPPGYSPEVFARNFIAILLSLWVV